MRFGTIGAGAVALAFAREALARGHEVVLSSRRVPDALVDKVAELGRVRPQPRSRMPRASTTCCWPCPGETSNPR
jgi:predicted dinucleotide-binding enzyme